MTKKIHVPTLSIEVETKKIRTEPISFVYRGGVPKRHRTVSTVEVDAGIKWIEDYAFQHWTSLTNISIPSTVVALGHGIFFGCKSLVSVTLPSTVTALGIGTFFGCSSLATITLPSSLKTLGNDAFYECTSLTSVTLPCTIKSLGNLAFFRCTSLQSITLPLTIQNIGNNTFAGCTSLVSVSLPSTIQKLGDGTFKGCKSLVSISLPSSIHTLGEDVFGWCSSLTSVVLPHSIRRLGSRAFFKCSSLSSIIFPSTITNIGREIFFDCSSLNSITLPPDSISILNDQCVSLTSICFHTDPPILYLSSFNSFPRLNTIRAPSFSTTTYARDRGGFQAMLLTVGYSKFPPDRILGDYSSNRAGNGGVYYDMRKWAGTRMNDGRMPLFAAAAIKMEWKETAGIFKACMPAVYEMDVWTGLPAFGLAAAGVKGNFELAYELLRAYPPAIAIGINLKN